ncbi:MAG: amino acid ABC transporter substrate-binding protein [Eggerthellaceae bacterium]|nr:amino acid ABC transporter substrate-binding protein [Eggerthellaceae bacterium]MDR2722045.1 amino acid ABC transporter substrate-binding protein [Coriobacteriaceae bacterium]
MKRRLTIIASLVLTLGLAVFMLAGCTGSEPEGQPSLEDRTTLVVGFDQDFPPYGYVGDDGEFTGFDLDLAKEVCERLGWEVEYKPINWDTKDLEISSGAIDCIWNGFTIEGREDAYTFTSPYMDNSQVVVVKADSGIATLEDLAGKTVMAQVDSAAFYLLDAEGDQSELAATFGKLMTVADYNSAFMELESGAVNAVAMDLPVAKFQIAGKESLFTILEETPLSAEHYGVGFLLGNTELRDQIEATLLEMVADGTVESLCEKYADQGISYTMWILR